MVIRERAAAALRGMAWIRGPVLAAAADLVGTPRRRRIAWSAAAGTALLAAAALLAALVIPLPERLSAPPSTVVTYSDGTPAHVFLAPDGRMRIPARPGEVDPAYVEALLRYEDKRFFAHPGVDPLAVCRAFFLNVRHGHIVSGGSTLTMQLIRMVEPRPRTIRSKIIEALRAVQIECRWSKEEILSAYLTFAPYGGNLEGVETACQAYFGHGASHVSMEEIAVLLAVPQRPARRCPSPSNRKALRESRDEIARWLSGEEALPMGPGEGDPDPDALLTRIVMSPVPQSLRPMPRHAPHAAGWLRRRLPGRIRIETTLHRGAQRTAENLLAEVRGEMAGRGIHNGAAVLLDHREGEIRALVGNVDFWDGEHGGQIVGFDVPRSPGSALKPFLYALALDRGVALPEHLVPDVPVAYGAYAPRNYDGSFSGLVRLEEALSRSLNVPFVRLLESVGLESFIGLLRECGAAHLRDDPGYYGLSAAIGSVEITPLELAGLYAALAEGGTWRRPVILRDEEAPGSRMFSKGAAYLTRRALARKDRPDFPQRRRFSGVPNRIHWKTGTSYGYRDAWAAGSGSRHTAAVWFGNFDNASCVDLVGSEAAAPVLFDLLEAVADRSAPPLPDAPSGDLKGITVCSYSGRLPGPACPDTSRVLALREHVPTETCPYHVAVDVDLETGMALAPGCRGDRPYETHTFITWPPGIRNWLDDGHRNLPSPPRLFPGCGTPPPQAPPRIVSPPAGQTLVLLSGVDRKRQEIPLQAETEDPRALLSWFIDGEYQGTVAAHEKIWWTPEPGVREFVVMDHSGLSSRCVLEVRERGRTVS